ncbi:terminase small subunit, partial [Staphylococcus epidermidis]|uniref:terminase small subunit n=1 Tax=Staphylococcus epidermidis TaxID=1282 RepID=UPI0037D9FC5E
MQKLTPKQQPFPNHYINTLNLTQTPIKPPYTPNTPHLTPTTLLPKHKLDQY